MQPECYGKDIADKLECAWCDYMFECIAKYRKNLSPEEQKRIENVEKQLRGEDDGNGSTRC